MPPSEAGCGGGCLRASGWTPGWSWRRRAPSPGRRDLKGSGQKSRVIVEHESLQGSNSLPLRGVGSQSLALKHATGFCVWLPHEQWLGSVKA